MTQQKIQENNELIAKFMGIEKICIEDVTAYRLTNSVYCKLKQRSHFPSVLFNVSWDWLIPVVQKIKHDKSSQLSLPMKGIENSIAPYLASTMPVSKALLSLNIEELWAATVEWIRWFNENKQHDNR